MTLAGQPIPFWDPAHRPNHFSSFQNVTVDEEVETDLVDPFA